MNAIELKDVGEKYRLKFIREGEVSWEEIWALKGVTFDVREGETLGLIGQNGSGKTTLLKLIAGMLIPDSGTVSVSGKVSTIMELGAGFNPEFTGRENIVINARIYGLDERALKETTSRVIEFSDLGKFIDAPVKCYSQGMYMRLAFSLALFVNPDILLIDDILAVGDEEAQQKCIKKVFELKRLGKTIIIVSHDMNMINKLCDRVIFLEKGTIIQEGIPEQVIFNYLETVGDKKGLAVLDNKRLRVVFNNGKITIKYNGSLVTKDLSSCVYYSDNEFNAWSPSSNLEWRVKQLLPDKIVAESLSQDDAVSQVWAIEIEEDELKWQVQIKDELIRDSHIRLSLVTEYNEWMDFYKTGVFPPFSHKTNWQEISSSGRAVGIKAGEDVNRCALLVSTDSGEGQVRLFNSGYEQEVRIIQINSSGRIIAANIKFYAQPEELKEYIRKEQEKILLRQKEERSRYIDMRTISCGDLRLFADEENKALRVFYKDREITKGSGLHSAFIFDKIWYDTSSCKWQLLKKEDTLFLTFYWDKPKFTQNWRLRFKDNVLTWNNELQVNPQFIPQALKFGLCAQSAYKSFFCGSQVQDFPAEFESWEDIPIENQNGSMLGLYKTPELPAVTWENKDGFSCLLQNSDSQSNLRVLQLVIPEKMLSGKTCSFSTQLNFLDDESLINDYIHREGNKDLLQQQEERARYIAMHNISSGNLRLFADEESNALRVFYKDREITKNSGLHSSFKLSHEKLWLFLRDGRWSIEHNSGDSLILKIEHQCLSEIWKCACKGGNRLELTVELEVNRPVLLVNYDMRIELQDIYKNWSTLHEDGELSSGQYVNNIAPIRLKKSKVTKVILKERDNFNNAGMLFETRAQSGRHILGIYKNRYPDAETTTLNLSLIIPKKEKCIEPGRYIYFEGAIAFDNNGKIQDEPQAAKGIELKSGNLIFLFDQGIGRLFSSREELTTGLGAYTSIRSAGIWYDSSQAIWEVTHQSGNKITVCGNWPHIPVSQYWQIELIGEDSFSWFVDMDVHEGSFIEIEQTSLMLACGYKEWVVPGVNSGEFLDEYTQDYDILPFRFLYCKLRKEGIMAKGGTLPTVIFRNTLQDEFSRMIAENTDYFYKGRLLQYQKSNTDKLSPKQYRYFAGVIKIEP